MSFKLAPLFTQCPKAYCTEKLGAYLSFEGVRRTLKWQQLNVNCFQWEDKNLQTPALHRDNTQFFTHRHLLLLQVPAHMSTISYTVWIKQLFQFDRWNKKAAQLCQYIIPFQMTPFCALSCDTSFKGSGSVYSHTDLWWGDGMEMGLFMMVPHQSTLSAVS